MLDFETLSNVHVYRIEYVSYRQGPYRIRIEGLVQNYCNFLYKMR